MINSTGFVGDYTSAVGTQTAESLCGRNDAVFADIMENILKAITSIGKGGEDIRKIVLRLEKHVDTEPFSDIPYRSVFDGVDYKTASEAAALELKKKKRRRI